MAQDVKPVLFGFGLLAAAIAGGAAVEAASPASTGINQQPIEAQRKSVSISNNSGGMIARFALKVAEFRNDGTLVKFSGRCDSACTLFLSLPEHQTCITSGAYFRFHVPSARSSRSVRLAEAYMMGEYPDWVLAWIAENGGLSSILITMNYTYASQFIPDCDELLSAQADGETLAASP